MKIMLPLTFLFCFALAASPDTSKEYMGALQHSVQKEIRDWLPTTQNLSQTDITLLENFLYFSAMASYYEGATRYSISLLQIRLNSMHEKIADNAVLTEETNQINSLLQKLMQDFLPRRQHSFTAWQSCLYEIEQSSSLRDIAVMIQLYGNRVISQYAKDMYTNTTSKIITGIETLDQHMQKLQFCRGSLQAITDNKNPFTNDSENIIQNIDTTLDISEIIFKSLNEITYKVLDIEKVSVEMLLASVEFFKIIYNEIYSHNVQVAPFALLYDDNGQRMQEPIHHLISKL